MSKTLSRTLTQPAQSLPRTPSQRVPPETKARKNNRQLWISPGLQANNGRLLGLSKVLEGFNVVLNAPPTPQPQRTMNTSATSPTTRADVPRCPKNEFADDVEDILTISSGEVAKGDEPTEKLRYAWGINHTSGGKRRQPYANILFTDGDLKGITTIKRKDRGYSRLARTHQYQSLGRHLVLGCLSEPKACKRRPNTYPNAENKVSDKQKYQ